MDIIFPICMALGVTSTLLIGLTLLLIALDKIKV